MSDQPFRLFCSDLDGTLLGNPEGTVRFNRAWSALRGSVVLCYSTGRTAADVLGLVREGVLVHPDYIIGSVGTELVDMRTGLPVPGFHEAFSTRWDLRAVETALQDFPGVERQPPEFLHPYKSSWIWRNATPTQLEELRARLAAAGVDASVVYSGGQYLDVLPAGADKGGTLAWLAARLGIPLSRVIVAGDSGNDVSMFLQPEVSGIVVENAQPELLEATVPLPTHVSTRMMADGVVEGLEAFGVLRPGPRADVSRSARPLLDPDLRRIADSAALSGLSTADRLLIAEGYREALAVVRRNMTPLGFSACPPAENEVTGTDENYHSVWARDGSMTLVWTIGLGQADITACGRQTLETLLGGISRNGQIPANVRLATGAPDYSGVGGICSIDGGLWLIIAFYNYVRHTQDTAFLSRHCAALCQAMRWLAAHDANDDGLLEIPEAGDWTDLFGRSYNVLYDEVLWFRANVCFGRLMEFAGDHELAAEHLRAAQRIRGRILTDFWPTTGGKPGAAGWHFASQQFQLGDTSYLLAQISPFSYNWRCDVFGNILAFLTNLMDAGMARTAFKFMWAAGVNDPWPVTNLYPAVQAGDPDWRDYYTVNLLNLPHHYHNGGIWPFIGGMWVRFIHRLGLSDVAAGELARLARINRMGRTSDWEFNEWLHGRTGRPMGKRYQAWSAASYLAACHDLNLTAVKGVED